MAAIQVSASRVKLSPCDDELACNALFFTDDDVVGIARYWDTQDTGYAEVVGLDLDTQFVLKHAAICGVPAELIVDCEACGECKRIVISGIPESDLVVLQKMIAVWLLK